MEATQIQFMLDRWLDSFILVFVRVLGFSTRGPVFSETGIPILARLGMALAFTIIISIITPSAPANRNEYNYFLSLGMNLVTGILIGFLTNLVLEIVQAAGDIMDNALGLNSMAIFDPSAGGQVTVLSKFLRKFGLVLFMICGGMEMTLVTLVKSFKIFPLTTFDLAVLDIKMELILKLVGDVIILAIIAASPVLIVLIFTDIVLALMSRAAQQINPFSLSFALKPLLGLMVIMFMAPFFQKRLVQIFLEGVQIFGKG